MESLVISVTVPSCEEDDLVGFFHEAGCTGIEVQNFDSDPITLCAFFPAHRSPSLRELMDPLTARLSDSSRASMSTTWVPHEEWTRHWRDSLRPFSVGASFLVIPGVYKEEPEAGTRIEIRIEPGMAFGTGTHESTQLCLRSLEQLPLQDRIVLDVGTGSGILSIAAVHRGARLVGACDIDPVAVQVAAANFEMNRVTAKTRVWVGSLDALADRCTEICFANLSAGILEGLWPEFKRVIAPQGWLVCSGILQEQGETLQEHLEHQDFLVERKETTNGWVCLVARKGMER